MIRVTKVKYRARDVEVVVHYEEENGQGSMDKRTLESPEPPAADFLAALEGLAEWVVDICELGEEKTSAVKVGGVSFSYAGERDVMGATISAGLDLASHPAPWQINTPHKPSEPYSEGGDASVCLASGCVRALKLVQARAVEFVEGKRGERAQGELAFDGNDRDKTEAAADAA